MIYTIKGFSLVNKAEVECLGGILLFFLWSNRCWQFNLWFLHLSKSLTSLVAQTVKASAYNAGDPGSILWVGKIHWRRKWQPTPVLLPGKSHGWRILLGYSPQSRKESDTTERLHFTSSLPPPFLSPKNIWKFLVHVLLRQSLKDFEHYLASMWNECNCTVVWIFFGIAFF